MIVRIRGHKIVLGDVLVWLCGTAVALLWFIPIWWMVSTSLKPSDTILTTTVEWLPRAPTLANYEKVFVAPVARWFTNSVIVTLVTTLSSVTVAAMAGYALARMHFPGRKALFFLTLALLMVPFEMGIVPLYLGFSKLKLVDTHLGIILPSTVSIFVTYLFRQSFLDFPRDLEDAAFIDGCSRLGIFWRVALPLSRPTLIAGTIIVFTGQWNDFLWPLLITISEPMQTLAVGMAKFRQNVFRWEDYGAPMAAMTLLAAPTMIVFLVLQRFFVEGVRMTGIKG